MNGLVLALLLVEIAGYAYVFHKLCRLPVVVAPAIYVSATVVCLFASDFLGLMWYARAVIHVAGWAAFALLVRDCIKLPASVRREMLLANSGLTAICVLFAAFLFLALYVNENLLFWKWDEFTYWGSEIKLLSELNTFHIKPYPLQFPDYPPGAALFAYHCLGLGGYSEGMAIVSYDIILLAFLMPLVANSFSADFLFGLVTIFLCYALVILFGHGWDSVNIDHIVSVMFAGAVMSYLTMGFTPRTIFATPLILAALTLTRQSGTYLALIAATICAVDMIILQLVGRIRSKAATNVRRFDFLRLFWVVAILATPLFMHTSWKIYLKSNNIEVNAGSIDLGSLLPKILKCCETERQINVTNSYFKKYFGLPNVEPSKGNIVTIAKDNLEQMELPASVPTVVDSTLLVFGFLVLSWLAVSLLLDRGSYRWRGVAMIAIIAAGMLAFSLSLLLTYIFEFNAVEAASLISFDRYHNTYVLSAFLMAFFWIGTTISRLGVIGRSLVPAVFAMWAYAFVYPAHATLRNYRSEIADERVALRHKLKPLIEPAIRVIPRDKAVYVFWLNTQGIEPLMINQELLPRISSPHCFSVVARPPVPMVETCIVAEPVLSNTLRRFDYAIVGEGLARMKQDYPSIWGRDIADDVTLFRIDKSQALVKMEPLTP